MKKTTYTILFAMLGAVGSVHAQNHKPAQPIATRTQAQMQTQTQDQTRGLVQTDGSVVLRAIPGVQEFSGRIIARPVQPSTLAQRGLSKAQMLNFANRAKKAALVYDLYNYEPLVDYYVLELPQGETEAQAINTLMGTGLFEYVEPDWALYPIGCPNDSRFNRQWHHNSTHMMSCEAWDLHTGNPSVGIGICDTGVQTDHPDLLLNRLEGYNAVNRQWESQGGQIGPVHPHGTMTTGCAAANGNNGTGVSGMGWNLSHRMLRVSNSSSGGSSLSTLTHAALTSIQAGDKVASVSYSGVNSNTVRSTATTIKGLGGLMIWAAGNDGANLNWGDRDADDVIVVGATNINDNKAGFSAFGRSVDVMAPGDSVFTTTTGSSYANVSGTSFSTPFTAGLAGLIWSFNPSLTPDQVEMIIKNGADDLGAAGIDDTYGYGRINSFNSLVLVGGGGPTYPFLEQFENTTLNDNVWTTVGGVINTNADNEPSAPNSLNLDNTDSLTSGDFDLSGVIEFPYVTFWTEHKGVENGKTITVEYRDIFGAWNTFGTIASDGTDQTAFSFHRFVVPTLAWGSQFAMRFSVQGADNTDDWYIDDIGLAPFTGNSIPFLEDFPTTTLDSATWPTVSGAVVNADASNEPSAPNSLNFDGTDNATTSNFLLQNAPLQTYVSFFVEHRGVENGKTFDVEYLNDSSNWVPLATFTSDGVDQNKFEFFQAGLFFDAFHDNYKLRFTANGADASDDWFVDDIRIGDQFTPPNDCVADFNGDGVVNTQDVTAFLNAWNAQDASADINGDGIINTQDVTAFLNAWNAGCP